MSESNITKKALAAAMKQQMAHAPFSKISVGDICDVCGINRKSFYYHFKDKYDLVNWIFYTEFLETVCLPEHPSIWRLLEKVCAYFYKERIFYRSALRVKGQNSLTSYFSETIAPLLEVLFRTQFPEVQNLSFFTVLLIDAFLSSITRWLTEEPQITAEAFLKQFKCILLGLSNAILQDFEPPDS